MKDPQKPVEAAEQPQDPILSFIQALREGLGYEEALAKSLLPSEAAKEVLAGIVQESSRLSQWISVLYLATREDDFALPKPVLGQEHFSGLMLEVMNGAPAPELGADLSHLSEGPVEEDYEEDEDYEDEEGEDIPIEEIHVQDSEQKAPVSPDAFSDPFYVPEPQPGPHAGIKIFSGGFPPVGAVLTSDTVAELLEIPPFEFVEGPAVLLDFNEKMPFEIEPLGNSMWGVTRHK